LDIKYLIALLIIIGAGAITLGIFKTSVIIKLLKERTNIRLWEILQVLMGIFIIGYAISAWQVLTQDIGPLAIITGLVFFFGGFFVLIILKAIKSNLISLKKYHLKSLAVDYEVIKRQNSRNDFAFQVFNMFKYPINTIMGLTEIAKECKDPDEVSKCIHTIRNYTQEMQEISNCILDFSKISSDDMAKEEIKLRSLVDEIVLKFRNSEVSEKIKLQVNIDDSLTMVSDKPRLKLVLEQLIANSVNSYNPNERFPFIKVNSQLLDHNLEISVEDNGIGLVTNQQEEIFTAPFKNTKKSKNGSSFGLYITKEIVESLGGKIMVQSNNLNGSRFIVQLPIFLN